MSSLLIADPQIKLAYDDVRNDKTDTNWLLLEYVDDRKDELKVSATGTGGYQEFLTHLKNDQAAFGYVRVTVGNDELSQRAKFILISWCGENVKVMRKAKLSVQLAEVKKVLHAYAVEVPANSLDELDQEKVMLLVRKAMGANYDRQSSAY